MHSKLAHKLWETGIWNKNTAFNFETSWKDPVWRKNRILELSNRWKDHWYKTYIMYCRYLSFGDLSDTCYLYAANTDSYFKFGVTKDPSLRLFTSNLRELESYSELHILLSSSRLEVANLEASIKLQFEGREYLKPEESHKFFSILKQLLATRPIANPFE